MKSEPRIFLCNGKLLTLPELVEILNLAKGFKDAR
tara:strand:+ start:611 stop:715 length:105 start_codon:yes stop_codon:yes gene_type:complete